MIIIMSCFFPLLLQNIHMNVSVTLFIIFCFEIYMLPLSYYSYYCSFLSKVVSYSQIGIIRYRTLYWIDNLLICIITHVIVHSFINCCCCCSSFHISSIHCFWTHIILIINQRFWYSFTMFLLFALLFVRLIIKIACTIGIDPILQPFISQKHEQMIDWFKIYENIWYPSSRIPILWLWK